MTTMATLALLMATMSGTPDGVVLDFGATWCGPCQQMLPIVHRLQQQGYAIRTVDVEREPGLAKQFNIDSYPTFVLVVRGEERGRFIGPMSESELRHIAGSIPAKAAATAQLVSQSPLAGSKPKVSSKQLDPQPTFVNNSKSANSQPIIRANVTTAEAPKYATDPMQVSTRLRVTDATGMDYGSGTIILSDPGETVLLTCGHIFRHFDAKSRIEVDVFNGSAFQRYEGTVLRYDLKKDVALVSIRTVSPLPVAKVAREVIREGEHVFSVGCGGGEAPAKLQHRVTKTTGYVEDIVECTGMPIQGRSGGGLFATSGEVVGVCILADPNGKRGLYMGLKTIHQLLEQCGFNRLLGPKPATTALVSAASTDRAPSLPDRPQFADARDAEIESPADDSSSLPMQSVNEPNEPVFADDADSKSRSEFNELVRASAATRTKSSRASAVAGPSVETLQETLEAAKGAEVVCIIRDPDRQDAPSRVVIIHRASDRFVSDLTGELEHQVQRTSMAVRPQVAATAKPVTGVSVGSLSVAAYPELQRYRRSR